MKILTKKQIEELSKYDTPTICNAIEKFAIRNKSEGFMNYTIKSIFPSMHPIVGYACTAKISSMYPPTKEQENLLYRYYQSILDSPKPTISVIQDIDSVPIGSFWGEIQANIHKSLGCIGTITNGGVRDIDEIQKLRFSYFASCVLVSHAYVHIEQVNGPVFVGGLTIRNRDLLHADKHGVVLIPSEIADEVADACKVIQSAEISLIKKCKNAKNESITVEEIKKWRQEMIAKRDSKLY